MKKSRLQKFAWVFFALVLGATTVFAQGGRNGKRLNNKQNNLCLEQISNLTENQKSSIKELNEQHQSDMTELRQEHRSITDVAEKTAIRDEMLEKVESHRDAVKNLLTAEQQEEYETLHARKGNFSRQGRGNCGQQGVRGNRGGRGKGAGFHQGRGMNRQGNQGLNRDNSQNYNQPGCIYYEENESKS